MMKNILKQVFSILFPGLTPYYREQTEKQ